MRTPRRGSPRPSLRRLRLPPAHRPCARTELDSPVRAAPSAARSVSRHRLCASPVVRFRPRGPSPTHEACLRRYPRGRRSRSGRPDRVRAARGGRRRHAARRAGGAGTRLVASPVAQRAEEAGIEVLKPPGPGTRSSSRGCREIAPDCCPVVAYGALLPQVALDIPAHGWVNLHFSLLPAWRGAAPVQHADHGGGRDHRRLHLPHRGGARLRARLRRRSPRRSGPPTPAVTC